MSNNANYAKCLPALCLAIILLAVVGIYQPGMHGGFLFDDYPNLEDLGTYGGVDDYETFKNFVFNGISGPLGRPVSLASFLLDDNTWPSDPHLFKPTNLKIHILTGLMLCWATLNLMRLFGRSEAHSIWIALFSSAIWLLHPYMVSTTLYIIQRMAQLAALFMFAGLAGYFYGRLILVARPLAGYIWMSASLGCCTLLSVYSKENGLLLPLTVLVIESCLPSALPKLHWAWRAIFLWLPTLVVIVLIAKAVNLDPNIWPERPFNQRERLLTEPRIIWEYLYYLYVPRIEGRGLFQDGYIISRGLFSPQSTWLALIGLIGLLSIAIFQRKRFPLIGIAILFFLASHLLESTVFNLELYFEHRNYAASAFLFLPIASGLVWLPNVVDRRLVYICGISLFVMLSFLTWKRTNLWSNSNQLELYWAASTPESARAQNRIGVFLLQQNRGDESIKHFEDASNRLSNSSLLSINLLLTKVYLNRAQEADFIEIGQRLKNQAFDAQAIKGMRSLVEKEMHPDVDEAFARYTLTLLDAMNSNPNYNKSTLFHRLYFYLKGMLHLRLSDGKSAFEDYSAAMRLYADTDSALSMVADFGNAGHPTESLLLLTQAEKIYQNQTTASLKRSRVVYDQEFKKMRTILELAEKSISTNMAGDANINEAQYSNTSKK